MTAWMVREVSAPNEAPLPVRGTMPRSSFISRLDMVGFRVHVKTFSNDTGQRTLRAGDDVAAAARATAHFETMT